MSEPDFPQRYGPWALVAGAAVGLGAEWARQLAAQGLHVVLVDRDAAPLERTAAAIGTATGRRTRTLVIDLARPDVGDAVAKAVADLEIGLVVYNAAIGTVSTFLSITPANIQAMLDVNCRGPLLVVHALEPAHGLRGLEGVRPRLRGRALGRDARARRRRPGGAAGLDPHAGLAVLAA